MKRGTSVFCSLFVLVCSILGRPEEHSASMAMQSLGLGAFQQRNAILGTHIPLMPSPQDHEKSIRGMHSAVLEINQDDNPGMNAHASVLPGSQEFIHSSSAIGPNRLNSPNVKMHPSSLTRTQEQSMRMHSPILERNEGHIAKVHMRPQILGRLGEDSSDGHDLFPKFETSQKQDTITHNMPRLKNRITKDGYEFEYEVADSMYRSETGTLQTGSDGKSQFLARKGSYLVMYPSGVQQRVVFTADERGYRATVVLIPSIVFEIGPAAVASLQGGGIG